MPDLSIIRLSQNQLQGPLPQSLSSCSQLYTLNLSRNYFTGLIPSLPSATSLLSLDLSSNFFFGSGVPLDSSGAPICPSLFLTVNTADNCLTFDPSACDGGGSSGGSGSGDGAVATRSVGMSSGGDSGAIWSAASDTSSGSGDGAVATRSIGVSSGSSSSSSTASIAAAEASPDSTTAGDLAVSSPHVLAHLASHEGKESAAFLGHTEREAFVGHIEREAFLGHSERMAMLGDRVERKGEQATSEAHVVLEGTEPRSRAHLASHEDNQRAAFLGHTERAAMLGDRGNMGGDLLGPLHKGNRRGNSRDNSRDNGRRRREEGREVEG
ncbi:hypothetical protein CLOP_g8951 [Closterium sp. NIES-67]|nr:hypothetical protein CLOP_g8951 [Closterium sp. NIES-67]